MRCVLLGGISIRKVEHHVYGMIPALSTRVRLNVPPTLGSRANLSSIVASVHVKIEVGVFVSLGPIYPPWIRQYSFSLSPSPSSASCLRVRSQKTSFNEVTHDANDSKMTIAKATHSSA